MLIFQVVLLVGLGGCTDPCASSWVHGDRVSVLSGPLGFERLALTDGICGPSFAAAIDADGDGTPELALSNFGKPDGFEVPSGELLLLDADASEVGWGSTALLSREEGVKMPNDQEVADVDADGDPDLLLGVGFLTCDVDPWTAPCGGLLWLENQGEAWLRHDIVPPGAELFHHHPRLLDVDGDGVDDVVSVGERYATPFGGEDRAEACWYPGLEPGVFAEEPWVMAEGLGSIPQPWDIDGDGDIDLASAEYFREDAASFAWLERVEAPSEAEPAGVWERHVIDDSRGHSIQLSLLEDPFGDGAPRAIGSNHVGPDEGLPAELVVYEIPADPREPWPGETIADDFLSEPGQGMGAPGIFGHGDIDGDGDMDLLVSGDGDRRVSWLEQTAPGVFAQHTLEEDLHQAGSMLVVDLDGDGANELVVSGYVDNVLFIYRREEAR